MEKYPEIMEAMNHCKQNSSTSCEGCPYRGKSVSERSCRQQLLVDAMEALALGKADNETFAEANAQLQKENQDLRKAIGEAKMQVLLVKESRDDIEMERNRLYTECNELREELKNRPEVGFDGDTFDASLDTIKRAACEASYWQGQADALKWALREVTIAANEEGGDDV